MTVTPIDALQRRGFSVTNLARANGCDPKHFRNALAGRSSLTPDEVIAVVDALRVPVTEALSDELLKKALR